VQVLEEEWLLATSLGQTADKIVAFMAAAS
jgi:hypothetical protein